MAARAPAQEAEHATSPPVATQTTATQPATTQATATQPATSPAVDWELPEAVRTALAATQDLAFDFHQSGFYAVVEYVKHSPHSPGFRQTPVEVRDWRTLLERTSDFRGSPVTVEGVVGASKDPYTLVSRPDLGRLWQLELQRPDQPLACTLIFTEPANDIPLNSTLRVTGYFIMIRQYYSRTGHVQQAALLVAPGPIGVSRTGPPPAARTPGPDWRWLVAALVMGLLVATILLRRTAARGRGPLRAGRSGQLGPRELHARRAAPMSLADDLAEWAEENKPEGGTNRGETEKPHDADKG